ncbi:helicase HerA-like domain-containing protein [Methanotorris formicicus]|uniref:HerA-ATP synthase, barrel domain n=1 Tax=Methanotorris formicicus Mc-S-70 TaxID=647171 RepID=H1KY74_9EURY|nr:ATP-binding protein [Methanotorris formicicus]EHP87434.1 HerA-ATP synthase, barrel domain [Methanotorris formicicus Mc-S-70]
MEKIIGYTIGETRTDELTFLAKHPPEVGDYVMVSYDGIDVLGMVESTIQGNMVLSEILSIEDLEKIRKFDDESSHYIIGKIKVLGDIKELKIPKIPPKPGTPIYKADNETLKDIFSNSYITIGRLATRDIEVSLDVNKLCSRHLAILAMTGMGKSNTVAVLMEELNKIGGTILVFDMHGEYRNIESCNFPLRKHVIEPKINIFHISDSDLADLAGVDAQATKQRPYIRKAIKIIKEQYKEKDFNSAEEYINAIIGILENFMEDENYKKDKDSIQTAIFRLEDLLQFKKDLIKIHYNPINEIKEHHINILPLESLDENSVDIIVSYFTKEILNDRKRAILENGRNGAKPIFLIFEEAHLIVPQNRKTKAKHYISRIAREGRKFGVGICLVSQRPKTLDAEALSQCSNLIISKLIEPNDQKHVQHASENLSEDLIKQLTSLNIGEAIIIGPCIKIPAIVKVNKFNGNYGGEDIDFIKFWKERMEEKEKMTKDEEEFYDDVFGDLE